MTRAHGWLHPRTLGRAHVATARAPAGLDALPPVIELGSLPPVYDQGSVGSCTAHALCGAVEIVSAVTGYHPADRPDRVDLYFEERALIGRTREDSGALIADGVSVLRLGWRSSPSCPTVWSDDWTLAPDPIPYASPRLVSAAALEITPDAIAWELASGRPVVVGIDVTAQWEQLSGDTLDDPEGTSVGGHAVCLVGYDAPARRWRVRNSWGASWGDGGYAWLPWSWTDVVRCGEAWAIRAVRRVGG